VNEIGSIQKDARDKLMAIQRTAQSGMQSKNDTDLAHRNFAIHQKILIIFGKKIPLRE